MNGGGGGDGGGEMGMEGWEMGMVISAVISAVMQPGGAGMDMVVSWEWMRKLSLTGLVINAVINMTTCSNGGRDGHGGKLGMDAETQPNGAGN